MPYEAPKGNLWKDDRKLEAKHIASDKKLLRKKKPTARRPETRDVKVVCDRCGKKEMVSAALAPANIGGDLATYICNRCLTGTTRR